MDNSHSEILLFLPCLGSCALSTVWRGMGVAVVSWAFMGLFQVGNRYIKQKLSRSMNKAMMKLRSHAAPIMTKTVSGVTSVTMNASKNSSNSISQPLVSLTSSTCNRPSSRSISSCCGFTVQL